MQSGVAYHAVGEQLLTERGAVYRSKEQIEQPIVEPDIKNLSSTLDVYGFDEVWKHLCLNLVVKKLKMYRKLLIGV